MRGLLVVVVLVLVAGLIFLGVWDFQPERESVEREVPSERYTQ